MDSRFVDLENTEERATLKSLMSGVFKVVNSQRMHEVPLGQVSSSKFMVCNSKIKKVSYIV